MKKLTTAAATLLAAFALCSCGGSTQSNVAKNDLLGKVPGYLAAASQLKDEYRQKAEGIKDMEEFRRLDEQFNARRLEYYSKAVEEGNSSSSIGKSVPFSGDVYDDFSVTDIVISSFDGDAEYGNATFELRFMVAPKRDIIIRNSAAECAQGEYSINDTRLYFAFMTADDHLIELGTINPFSSSYYNMKVSADRSAGDTVKAGELCNSTGSPYNICCHAVDYTGFAKVVFFTEEDYMNIRRQAYGF